MASQPNHPTYPSQPGQPTYGWSVPVDQGDSSSVFNNKSLANRQRPVFNVVVQCFIIPGPPPPYNPNPPPNQQPPPAPASNMYGGADYESGGLGDAAFSFSEKSIRMAFVRYEWITNVTWPLYDFKNINSEYIDKKIILITNLASSGM